MKVYTDVQNEVLPDTIIKYPGIFTLLFIVIFPLPNGKPLFPYHKLQTLFF